MASFILINGLTFLGGFLLGRWSGLIQQPREIIVTLPVPQPEPHPEYKADPEYYKTPPQLFPETVPRCPTI